MIKRGKYFFAFLLVSAGGIAQNFFKNNSIYFTPVELGSFMPLKPKANNKLPQPVSLFANEMENEFCLNFLKLGIVHKKVLGAEAYYNFGTYSYFKNDKLQNYLTDNFPGYSAGHPDWADVKWKGYNVAAFYDLKSSHNICVTPKVQLGVNSYHQDNVSTYVKEYGSNQFIEYSILNTDRKNYFYSAHFILNVAYEFNTPVDVVKTRIGLKGEYMHMNLPLRYEIVESGYNKPTVSKAFDVTQKINAFSVCVFFCVRFGE